MNEMVDDALSGMDDEIDVDMDDKVIYSHLKISFIQLLPLGA